MDLTQIEGLDALTVQTVLSEIGLDPGRFPTCKRFTSWLCLCPDNRITGGRIKSSRTRPSANRTARPFAWPPRPSATVKERRAQWATN